MNFQMFKLVLEKAKELEIKLKDHKKSNRVIFGGDVSYYCFSDYAKVFDCMDHNKLWKILQEMRIPDHLNCLLRNLYAGQKSNS